MPKEFKLPNLGEGIKEGTVVSVRVKAGDEVAEKDVVLELETNKAVMDIESPFSGRVARVAVKAGDKVRVGALLMELEGAGQAAAPVSAPPPPRAEAAPPAPRAASVPAPPPSGPGSAGEPARPGMGPEECSKFRVVVVGAGPGGYAAAFFAADLGFQVTLVNKETRLGGVCTLRGCIPSKGLLHVAKLINEARHAPEWGVDFGAPKVDLDRLRAWKDGYVNTLASGIGQVAAARKVKVVEGEARFQDARHLRVLPGEGGKAPGEAEIEFDYAILATGSSPAFPKPWDLGDDRVMDSTGALQLKDIPGRLLVIGGGYIGLEMACVYAALGSAVTVVEFLPGLLMAADRDLVRPLEQRLKGQFKAVFTNTKVEKLEASKEGIRAHFSGEGVESPQVFDRVLVSVGRRPNSQGLGLENTRVNVGDKGFVEHDAQLRTAEPNIFVVGDVAGEPMLAHKAHAEARVAVEAMAGRRSAYDVVAMPAVVFTDPELAWVGVTEDEAKKRGLDVEVARYPWAASGKAHAISRTEGLSKVIVEKSSGRLLGAGAVGWEAGNLISEYALALEMGALAEDVSLTVHPHPTLGETLMGAADVYLGHATDLYRPKRR